MPVTISASSSFSPELQVSLFATWIAHDPTVHSWWTSSEMWQHFSQAFLKGTYTLASPLGSLSPSLRKDDTPSMTSRAEWQRWPTLFRFSAGKLLGSQTSHQSGTTPCIVLVPKVWHRILIPPPICSSILDKPKDPVPSLTWGLGFPTPPSNSLTPVASGVTILTLTEDSIRPHRLRAQSHKTATSSPRFRHQLEVHVVTGLLDNQLQIGSPNNPFFGFD